MPAVSPGIRQVLSVIRRLADPAPLDLKPGTAAFKRQQRGFAGHKRPQFASASPPPLPQPQAGYRGKPPPFQAGPVPTAPLRSEQLYAAQQRGRDFTGTGARLPEGGGPPESYPLAPLMTKGQRLFFQGRPNPITGKPPPGPVPPEGTRFSDITTNQVRQQNNLLRLLRQADPRAGKGSEDIAFLQQRAASNPATGKFLLDDPEAFQQAKYGAAYWLNYKALPASMRRLNRDVMFPGKKAEKVIQDDIGKLWDESTQIERDIAHFDMNAALMRHGISQTAVAQLRKHPDAMKTIQGVYIHANRIRAIEELLVQRGWGSQRKLHNISGMIFKRSQRLAEALEMRGERGKALPTRFLQELKEWEGIDKFLSDFGKAALYVGGRVALSREKLTSWNADRLQSVVGLGPAKRTFGTGRKTPPTPPEIQTEQALGRWAGTKAGQQVWHDHLQMAFANTQIPADQRKKYGQWKKITEGHAEPGELNKTSQLMQERMKTLIKEGKKETEEYAQAVDDLQLIEADIDRVANLVVPDSVIEEANYSFRRSFWHRNRPRTRTNLPFWSFKEWKKQSAKRGSGVWPFTPGGPGRGQ